MFRSLGKFITHYWPLVILAWIGGIVMLSWAAPRWGDVARGGEFAFLPENFPSRRAETLLKEAFPNDLLRSTVVLVFQREDNPQGLDDNDLQFIEDVVRPKLEAVAEAEGGLAPLANAEPAPNQGKHSIIAEIRTPADRAIGPLLISNDRQAGLVIVGLTTDFMESRNGPTVARIERLVADLRDQNLIPPGLDVSVTGSATLGRDTLAAQAASAHAAEFWTILLVVVLLLVIYRAPLLALVPLATLAVGVTAAVKCMALLAQGGYIDVFEGLQVYMNVIAYGAGVDYTLFLTARYRESLAAGLNIRDALAEAIEKVGAAIVASAGTVICGIAMMAFAQFGKFHDAGIGISFSLFVVFCAVMTFSPALLRLTGPWAFWPWGPPSPATYPSRCPLPESPVCPPARRTIWDRIGAVLYSHPGTTWLATVGMLAPFAIVAMLNSNNLMYGLVQELPANVPSAVGQRILQQHFPAGIVGPVTLLLENREVDFSSSEGQDLIESLIDQLQENREELRLADIRSVVHPLGVTEAADRGATESATTRLLEQGAIRRRSLNYYVSHATQLDHHVTRIDLILEQDPFARVSIRYLGKIEREVASKLPAPIHADTPILTAGPTASIRDVQTVGRSDRIRINTLVLVVVFVILVLLLRAVAISLYLILSVIFSYLATLGMTFLFFWALDPSGFQGLDWTVPVFLFTVLVAVGEDYNIFLMTRIHEEQHHHGLVHGITVALARTGGIITSCGFIMAGTFSALMTGSLARMVHLGFALALGVLLDTFVVRPILVPAFLIMMAKGYFGSLGKRLVKPRTHAGI
jgi:RND superfamily putative drug exporter